MLEAFDLREAKPVLYWLCSRCGTDHKVPVGDLILGGEGGNPDSIELPICDCGTRSIVHRTWDTEQHADSPVRRAINSLAMYLKESGQVHPKARPESREPHFMWVDTIPPADLTGRKRGTLLRQQREAAEENRLFQQAESQRREVLARK